MKTIKFKTVNMLAAVVVLLVVLSAAGCEPWDRIDGNGSVISEQRTVVPFNRVESDGNFRVKVIQDSIFDIVVQAESNLVPYIRTRVHNNTLEIDTRENLNNHEPMWVFVHMPSVRGLQLDGSGLIDADNLVCSSLELELNGSGDIFCTVDASNIRAEIDGSGEIELDMTADYLDAKIDGSGDFYLEGSAYEADMDINGSGDMHAYNLVVERCFIDIDGTGNAEVYVVDLLDVNISGTGNVYYLGSPQVNTKISGTGKVIHAI